MKEYIISVNVDSKEEKKIYNYLKNNRDCFCLRSNIIGCIDHIIFKSTKKNWKKMKKDLKLYIISIYIAF